MWIQIAISVALSLISYALSPKPKSRAPTAGKLELPQIEPSAAIPVVFGTVLVKDPTIVWYGDLRTAPIKTDAPKK
jgi:hypothetical protein